MTSSPITYGKQKGGICVEALMYARECTYIPVWTHTCGIFVCACMWTDALMFVHMYAARAGTVFMRVCVRGI